MPTSLWGTAYQCSQGPGASKGLGPNLCSEFILRPLPCSPPSRRGSSGSGLTHPSSS